MLSFIEEENRPANQLIKLIVGGLLKSSVRGKHCQGRGFEQEKRGELRREMPAKELLQGVRTRLQTKELGVTHRVCGGGEGFTTGRGKGWEVILSDWKIILTAQIGVSGGIHGEVLPKGRKGGGSEKRRNDMGEMGGSKRRS